MKTRSQSIPGMALTMVVASTLALTSADAAMAVHVNFDDTVHDRTDLVGPAGGTGEVWNQNMQGEHSVTHFWDDDVLDSAGVATGIGWSLEREDSGFLYRWDGSAVATLSMLKHGIYTNSDVNHTLTLTGLDPARAYDLYITGYATGLANKVIHSTGNTTPAGFQVLEMVGNPGESANWVLHDNYIVFEDMVPDGSGTLTVDALKVSSYGFWSGFQLVEAEPSPPPVFRITSFSPVGGDTWELTLEADPDTLYEFRSSPDLDFNPGNLIEGLTQGDPGTDPGTVKGSSDEFVTTDGDGDATVRVALTGPGNFIRARDPGPLNLLAAVRAGLPRKVVIAGTSLSTFTYGNWPGLMEPWLKGEAPDPTAVTVVNLAISGSTSETGGINQLTSIKIQNPDTVFMEFSMNDAYTLHSISQAQSETNHNIIINDLRAFNPDIEIIIQTMNNPTGNHLSNRPEIAAYYQVARDVATAHGLLLIDHYPNWEHLFSTDLNTWNSYVPDGIHPDSTGYADVLMPELQQALEQ